MSPTAPPEVQARLLDLQAFDTELARLASERRRVESGAELAAADAERLRLRRDVADRRGTRDDLRAAMRRTESDVAVVEQRLIRDRQRLATTASPKDAQGLEQEVAALLRRRGILEDAELEVMQQIEDTDAALAAAEDELAASESRTAGLQDLRDRSLAAVETAHQTVAADRRGLADELPADLVTLYDRQRTRYGVGAALLRRGVSGGSNVQLTGADLAEIRAAAPDAVLLDPESGCILVRTDESGL